MIKGHCNRYEGAWIEIETETDANRVRNAKPVTVIEDPTGAFKTGAVFMITDFKDGLRARIWPDGMTVECEGDYYKVTNHRHTRDRWQKLERM
jgi:hypothetical protein